VRRRTRDISAETAPPNYCELKYTNWRTASTWSVSLAYTRRRHHRHSGGARGFATRGAAPPTGNTHPYNKAYINDIVTELHNEADCSRAQRTWA